MISDSFLVVSLGDGKRSIVDIFVSFLPVCFLIGFSLGLLLDLVEPLQSGLSNMSPSILVFLVWEELLGYFQGLFLRLAKSLRFLQSTASLSRCYRYFTSRFGS